MNVVLGEEMGVEGEHVGVFVDSGGFLTEEGAEEGGFFRVCPGVTSTLGRDRDTYRWWGGFGFGGGRGGGGGGAGVAGAFAGRHADVGMLLRWWCDVRDEVGIELFGSWINVLQGR